MPSAQLCTDLVIGSIPSAGVTLDPVQIVDLITTTQPGP